MNATLQIFYQQTPRPTTHDPRPTTHDPRPTTRQQQPTSDTFYCKRTTDESTDGGTGGGSSGRSSGDEGKDRGEGEGGGGSGVEEVQGGKEGREYLQERLKKHQLWTQRWFWEDALLTGKSWGPGCGL